MPQGFDRHVSVTDGTNPVTQRELHAVHSSVVELEKRIDRSDQTLSDQITKAVSTAIEGRFPTAEEMLWTRLAIKREAQSIDLRRAIIEKTLTGLAWMFILWVGTLLLGYMQAHGWKS